MPTLECIRTFRGSPEEGFVQKGEVFETTAQRAKEHIKQDRARPFRQKEEQPAYDTKEERPSYQTKSGQATTSRRWEGDGSWKTFFAGGERLGKKQVTKEEANRWQDGALDFEAL